MKVSNKLKEKIVKFFDNLFHDNRTKAENKYMEQLTYFDGWLVNNGYLKIIFIKKKMNIVPTKKLLFLNFNECGNLINDFIINFPIYENNSTFNILKKRFEFYYDKLRDNFGKILQEKNIISPLKDNVLEKIEFNYYHTQPYISNYSKLDRKYKKYIDFFKIQEQYSLHSEIITEIQVKMNKYNRVKRKHLCNCCPSLTEIKIEDLAFHEYKYVNKNKTPLWKLKQDIYKKIKNEIS